MSRANESVTPFKFDYGNGNHEVAYGLTIREHFAAMAMQGLCANALRAGCHFIAWREIERIAPDLNA